MQGDREKALEVGFNEHLSKPITPETFVQQIEGVLASARQTPLNQLDPQHLQHGQILVVDDLPANRALVVTLIRHSGHQALEAADGAGRWPWSVPSGRTW